MLSAPARSCQGVPKEQEPHKNDLRRGLFNDDDETIDDEDVDDHDVDDEN